MQIKLKQCICTYTPLLCYNQSNFRPLIIESYYHMPLRCILNIAHVVQMNMIVLNTSGMGC